jgi:hypothetical protein
MYNSVYGKNPAMPMIAVKSKNDFGVHSVQLGQYVFGHCTTL